LKILTKTLVYFIVTSLIVFLAGGLILYGVLKHTFYRQIDEGLYTEKSIIEEEIQHNKDIPDYSLRFGHEIEVIIYRHPVKNELVLKDTAIYDTTTMQDAFYRFLKVADNKKKQGYTISILHPLSGRHLLFTSVTEVILIMFLVIMFISIIINYIVSRKLWLPFYETIRKISNYDVKDKSLMEFSATNITEFQKLNAVLNQMSIKIRQDFFNLKEFTENASHEIQTPLAIAKSKLEILIQSENLSKSQLDLIQSVDESITRLSKLNTGLLLISKIDNNQYSEFQTISVGALIEHSVENLEDFINRKDLKVTLDLKDRPELRLSPVLAEILINNLINNAIKHNYTGGFIKVELTSSMLTVSNSGEHLNEDPEKLFNRFKKSNKNSDSLGLGLAIVRKICNYHGMNIRYVNRGEVHTILIEF
jgi:signal transduction histidine kinase